MRDQRAGSTGGCALDCRPSPRKPQVRCGPNDKGWSGPSLGAAPTALRSFSGLSPSPPGLGSRLAGGPPPDFLWNLVASVNFMRLSSWKGAHAVLSDAAWQEILVRASHPWQFAGSSFVEGKESKRLHWMKALCSSMKLEFG